MKLNKTLAKVDWNFAITHLFTYQDILKYSNTEQYLA